MTDKDKRNDTDCYVVPNKERGGWDVVREDHKRASAHTDTKPEAILRARQIVTNEGGGEVCIADKHGKFQEGQQIKGPKQPSALGPRRAMGHQTFYRAADISSSVEAA